MNLNLDIGHASRAGRKAVNEDFAAALSIPHPQTGARVRFTAPWPADLAEILKGVAHPLRLRLVDNEPKSDNFASLKRSIAETAEAYALPKVPTAAELFNPAFLPARADRSL